MICSFPCPEETKEDGPGQDQMSASTDSGPNDHHQLECLIVSVTLRQERKLTSDLVYMVCCRVRMVMDVAEAAVRKLIVSLVPIPGRVDIHETIINDGNENVSIVNLD